jgi:hypothetical protein
VSWQGEARVDHALVELASGSLLRGDGPIIPAVDAVQGVVAAEIKRIELSIRYHQSLPSLELDPAPWAVENILRPCLVTLEAVEREPPNTGPCLQNADLLLQLRDVSLQLHDFERIALGNAQRPVVLLLAR